MCLLPEINTISYDDGTGNGLGAFLALQRVLDERGLLTHPHYGRNYTSLLSSLFSNATLNVHINFSIPGKRQAARGTVISVLDNLRPLNLDTGCLPSLKILGKSKTLVSFGTLNSNCT